MILRCSLTFVCLVAGLRDVISQHGCCGPQQWTGVAIQKRGRYDHNLDVASLADLNTRIGYDYVNRKISLQQKIYNITVDTQESVHVIYDFKQRTVYSITNGNYCIANTISGEMWPNCIPDSATHLGTFNISGPTVNIYRMVTPGGATVRFSVSYGECNPSTESVLTSGPVYDLTVSVYENVTKGISDPSVFKVPTFCHHKETKTKHISSTITELLQNTFISRRR
ncbi:uncharacterized protein LOC144625892 [Crassostrea virginica]